MKITDTLQRKLIIEPKRIPLQDFRLVMLGAIVLLLLMVLGENIFALRLLRIVLGLAYVLVIPGYCLSTALFPQVSDLNSIERAGLSIGFSIASVSILAIVLDRLSWGLHPWSILLGEFGMIGLFIAMTLWRRSKLPIEAIYVPRIAAQKSLAITDQRLYRLLIGGVLLIFGLAIWVFLTPTSDQFTTEFYILGPDRLIAGYPYQVKPNDQVSVTVGVINREKSELNYHFEVWVVDSLDQNRRERVMQSTIFSLPSGKKYEQNVSWHMPWAGDAQRVDLLLFSNSDPAPFRQLRMWIDVHE